LEFEPKEEPSSKNQALPKMSLALSKEETKNQNLLPLLHKLKSKESMNVKPK
jgi:hypothetical protein